jgi:hypothetical protein
MQVMSCRALGEMPLFSGHEFAAVPLNIERIRIRLWDKIRTGVTSPKVSGL